MIKEKLNETLIDELSAAHIALAKQIYERVVSSSNPWATTVANSWVYRARYLNEDDWIAGAKSLSIYFEIKDPKRAKQAQDILMPYTEKYRVGRKKMYCGAHTPSAEVIQAKYILNKEYSLNEKSSACVELQPEPVLHGATRGAYPNSNRMTSPWKTKFKGVITWLKNPN